MRDLAASCAVCVLTLRLCTGKFQKEKTLSAFQHNFGGLPPRAMLEITEMVFRSSSMRRRGGGGSAQQKQQQQQRGGNAVKLRRDIFLPEPKPVHAYTRLKMFRPDEASMEGLQTAGCHSQYYTRMMQARLFVHASLRMMIMIASHFAVYICLRRLFAAARTQSTRSCSSTTMLSESSSST